MERRKARKWVNPKFEERPGDLPQARGIVPEPGFFEVWPVKRRTGQASASVAAEIRHEPPRDPETGELLDRSWYWSVSVNGRWKGPSIRLPMVGYWVWERGRRISYDEYKYLLEDRRWAKRYAPSDPEAEPSRAVSWGEMPPVF